MARTRYLDLPRYLLRSGVPRLAEAFEAATDWTDVTGATITDNATANQFSQGAQGVKLAASGNAIATMRKTLGAPIKLTEGNYLGVDLYAHQTTLLGMLFFAWETPVSKGFQINPGTALSRGIAGFNRLYLPKTGAAVSIQGGMTWSDNVNAIDVRLSSSVTGQAVTVDNLTWGLDPMPAVCFVFHDTWIGHYTTAYPLFRARKLRASLAINTAGTHAPGAANKMTYDQINEIIRIGGWTALCHGTNHTSFTAMADQAAVEADISTARAALIAGGLPSDHVTNYLAYPGGSPVDDKTLAAVAAQGVLFAHGSSETGTRWPYPDVRQMGSRVMSGGQTLATYKGEVDGAISTGSTVIFVAHDVSSGGDITEANLAALLDYCIARRVPVLTWDELYRVQQGPIRIPSPW